MLFIVATCGQISFVLEAVLEIADSILFLELDIFYFYVYLREET